ncbi:hypothetical protein L2E82_37735 [Cichorium intybus]|uniref:Uncharacterized protein n=1 Tax=Cichorium intybus TaxID=13427 RepID=A0ACB9AES3_CICIN|nr:hypothetical protein L2E82_37735 [Cichorium intybus]
MLADTRVDVSSLLCIVCDDVEEMTRVFRDCQVTMDTWKAISLPPLDIPLFILQKGQLGFESACIQLLGNAYSSSHSLPPILTARPVVSHSRKRRNPNLLPVSVVVVQCLITFSRVIITVVIFQTRVQIEIKVPLGTRVPFYALRDLRPNEIALDKSATLYQNHIDFFLGTTRASLASSFLPSRSLVGVYLRFTNSTSPPSCRRLPQFHVYEFKLSFFFPAFTSIPGLQPQPEVEAIRKGITDQREFTIVNGILRQLGGLPNASGKFLLVHCWIFSACAFMLNNY